MAYPATNQLAAVSEARARMCRKGAADWGKDTKTSTPVSVSRAVAVDERRRSQPGPICGPTRVSQKMFEGGES